MNRYNQIPNPSPPIPTAFQQGIDIWRAGITHNLNNGTIDNRQALLLFENGIDNWRIKVAQEQGDGIITPEEAAQRDLDIRRARVLGLNPTPESIARIEEHLSGNHKAQKDPYSLLKDEILVTQKWWQGKSGHIEVTRTSNGRFIGFIGRVGLQRVIDSRGSTTFVSARKLYKQHPTKLLEAIQRNETAQYLLPGESPNTPKYAQPDPTQPNRPLIHLVGDITQPIGTERMRIERRKAQIEHRQLLYRRERRGLHTTEHGMITELHSFAEKYKKDLGSEVDYYLKERDRKVEALLRAQDTNQRVTAFYELKDTTTYAATYFRNAGIISSREIADTFHSIARTATASLNQNERDTVDNITNSMNAAFTDTGADATWDRQRFDAAQVKALLPKRSVPFASERTELVRAALNERIATIAETLAWYGKNADAEQMLRQFKKMGILHTYAYQAIKVMTNRAYIGHMYSVQDGRTVPGNPHAYLDEYHIPYSTVKIPPSGERNRKALYLAEADYALEVIIDDIVLDQIDELRFNLGPMPNTTENQLLMVSSMHDKHIAAACRNYFSPPAQHRKKGNIIQRLHRRLSRSATNQRP